MAFLANANSQFALNQLLTLTASGTPWTLTMPNIPYNADGLLIGGDGGGNDPYIGYFGDAPSIRLGDSVALPGTWTIGQSYTFVVSNDGAGTTTLTVNGISESITQTADIVVDLFLRYGGSFDSGVRFIGLVGGTWDFAGIPGGDRSYNWEQAPGSTTLPDTIGGNTATLVGSGKFQPISDTTAPIITLVADTSLNVEQNTVYNDAGATASDNVDGDITANIVTANPVNTAVIGTYTVTYNVSDAAGNAATEVTRTVNVVAPGPDLTAPVITILGDNPATVIVGNAYNDAGATSSDNVDGDVTANIITVGIVDVNTIASYNITYDVTDAAGNAATQAVRTVNVIAQPVGSISITSITDFASKKWDANFQATFTIAGTKSDPTSTVEVSVGGGAFVTLDATVGSTSFTGDVVVTRQQDVIVRLTDSPLVTDTVLYVTAGLVVCDGVSQSNGAGRGLNIQAPAFDGAKPKAIMWKVSSGFREISDPTGDDGNAGLGGSMWTHIAKKYSNLGIPLIIGNVSFGGTTAAQWIPGAPEDYHSRITAFAAAAGGLSFLTTIIGESDAQASTGAVQFEIDYLAAVNPIIAAYDCDVYLTDTCYGNNTSGRLLTQIYPTNAKIVTENARILFGGTLQTINIDTTTAVGNDGLHLKQDADLEQAADIRFAAFTGIASIASIDMTNIPDGDYDVAFFDATDLSTSFLSSVTAVGGSFALPTSFPIGTEVVGVLPGATPPTTGGAIYGVTE